MTKLFVGNLSWNTDDESLRRAFERYGVSDAVVLKDRETNRSRGFGFVTVENPDAAVSEWNEKELDGRNIRVQVAAAREGGFNRGDRPSRGREGGYGRGGDNEGGYSRGGYRSREL